MKEPVRLEGLPKDPRDRKSLLISIALHTIFVVAISSMAIVPILNIVRGARDVKPERVLYLQTQEPKPPKVVRDSQPRPTTKQPAKAPDRREDPPPALPPATTAAPPVAVIPPTEVPVTIPPPRAAGGGDTTDKRLVGRDLLPGLSPGLKDPRLLGLGNEKGIENGPLAPHRNMADSVTHVWIRQFWDSVARNQNLALKRPPSWTIGQGDKKVGVDPAWIYFGKFKVPTALLALIPIKTQANPSVFERQRALASMKYEIEYQAMRSENSKDFEDAVKELRARKEAEHAAKANNNRKQ